MVDNNNDPSDILLIGSGRCDILGRKIMARREKTISLIKLRTLQRAVGGGKVNRDANWMVRKSPSDSSRNTDRDMRQSEAEWEVSFSS